MRFAPIIIIEALYCLSYKSQAPRIRPSAAVTSPTLGNILINVSSTAGVTKAMLSVTGIVMLCVIMVIPTARNGKIIHAIIHTNPILLNTVSDFQKVIQFAVISGQTFPSFLKHLILIISEIKYMTIRPQNKANISCRFTLK